MAQMVAFGSGVTWLGDSGVDGVGVRSCLGLFADGHKGRVKSIAFLAMIVVDSDDSREK